MNCVSTANIDWSIREHRIWDAAGAFASGSWFYHLSQAKEYREPLKIPPHGQVNGAAPWDDETWVRREGMQHFLLRVLLSASNSSFNYLSSYFGVIEIQIGKSNRRQAGLCD